MIAENVEARIQHSRRLLRAWHWMSMVSDCLDHVVGVLTEEARFLVNLGRRHAGKAVPIGRLIVGYQRLISALKHRLASPLVPKTRIDGPERGQIVEAPL